MRARLFRHVLEMRGIVIITDLEPVIVQYRLEETNDTQT